MTAAITQAQVRLDFGKGWLQTADAQDTFCNFCQGHEAGDPEELPRFASGLMAVARYSIASETGDFALEVEAGGILEVSEAFMKLGIESWEDLDYVRDSNGGGCVKRGAVATESSVLLGVSALELSMHMWMRRTLRPGPRALAPSLVMATSMVVPALSMRT